MTRRELCECVSEAFAGGLHASSAEPQTDVVSGLYNSPGFQVDLLRFVGRDDEFRSRDHPPLHVLKDTVDELPQPALVERVVAIQNEHDVAILEGHHDRLDKALLEIGGNLQRWPSDLE